MSKMGDWVIDLKHDLVDLTRDEFISKHGAMFAYIFDQQLGTIPKKETIGEQQYGASRKIQKRRSADRTLRVVKGDCRQAKPFDSSAVGTHDRRRTLSVVPK